MREDNWENPRVEKHLQLGTLDCFEGLGMFLVCPDIHGVDPWHEPAPTKHKILGSISRKTR